MDLAGSTSTANRTIGGVDLAGHMGVGRAGTLDTPHGELCLLLLLVEHKDESSTWQKPRFP